VEGNNKSQNCTII